MGESMSVQDVMEEIRKDIAFFDESVGGVTLSGGEPLMQRILRSQLLKACREQEIHTVLDTCGLRTLVSGQKVCPPCEPVSV